VLRWNLELGVTVLVKSAQPERIAANIDVLRFSLSPDEVARINGLSR
jgi:diketogulonate reductase-like aldo/keto reductase